MKNEGGMIPSKGKRKYVPAALFIDSKQYALYDKNKQE